MPSNRDHIINEINELLLKHGFDTSNIYDRSCFDLVARRELILLLMKVLVNVDAFSPAHAQEIKRVAHTFLASPLLIGLKSKNEILEEDVVYERHGIPVIAPTTLRNIVVEGIFPEIFAGRGGYYVQIDGQIVKEVREEQNLSLKDLADQAHISRETLYKYETGRARAQPETAFLLESILNMKITLSVNLFQTPQKPKTPETGEGEPRELVDLGFGVINTNRTPFDALAKPEIGDLDVHSKIHNSKIQDKKEPLITDLEKNRNQKVLQRMATNLNDLSAVIGTEAVFILEKKKKVKCIDGVPVVHSWEIGEMKSPAEFFKMLAERRECN
ncbi:MAG: transcriptional regulator [Methanobacteriaceae archaeon]|nr:transcriptional regulator [Methanobacteriaceae archaeon]